MLLLQIIYLHKHAKVLIGDQSSSWQGNTVQVVQPSPSLVSLNPYAESIPADTQKVDGGGLTNMFTYETLTVISTKCKMQRTQWNGEDDNPGLIDFVVLQTWYLQPENLLNDSTLNHSEIDALG